MKPSAAEYMLLKTEYDNALGKNNHDIHNIKLANLK